MPRRAAPALVLALSVLLGALLLCVRPGEPHSVAAAVRGKLGGRAVEHGPGQTRAAGPARPALPSGPHAVCAAPGELPGCSPFSHVTPGVLPAPPPALPVTAAAGGPVARPADGAGRLRPDDAPARAPDLHALQVLRS
ncbi:hypothetical protein AB0953_30150 [Streptomyces sp. NPDC046866]|uniref:hypothetical protein n=1 Tax=Streptomyces sp. NPDC046866 TaxID=3154921 RepID=UPI0034540D77